VPDTIEITPVSGPVSGSIRPPGSKSITNRALACAALADGKSRLSGALHSEDTVVMTEALRSLGIDVDVDTQAATIAVDGCGGNLPSTKADLYVANSGTTVRFLTALVAIGHGTFRLDGTARMRERPIADLVDALQALGVDVQCEQDTNCPPVVIRAAGLTGGAVRIRGDISSQYLSGLLMAAPYARQDTHIEIEGDLVSVPYVDMTLAVMRQFGAHVTTNDGRTYTIPSQQTYSAQDYTIEPDASAASYFWAAAAITGGTVTVEGLSRTSLQGDVAFCECLAAMGCDVQYNNDSITVTGNPLRGIDTNMCDISDTVQTLSAVAMFAESPTTITGVDHIRHKETDRIGNLAIELRKLGAGVEELADGLRVTPQPRQGASIATYNDHRMAMSLSLVGLKTPGVIIEDPGCTEKTYPHFFKDLRRLCAD